MADVRRPWVLEKDSGCTVILNIIPGSNTGHQEEKHVYNIMDDEIQSLIEKYRRIETIVDEKLHQIFGNGVSLIHITHRIKTADSIKGKLERKPDLYARPSDIYDILGFRVICYFSADIDLAARLINENFTVDWSKSKDKRQLIDSRTFGYVAVHYVCSLPEALPELSDLQFEIQIKTILQHSWAEIEHDLGYKTEIEIPRNIRRSFSKAASLLEAADDIFSGIKVQLAEYSASMKENIARTNLDDISFDRITLAAFTEQNETYRNLLNEIADITKADITERGLESQLPLIDFLEIRSLGEMVRLIETEHDLALELARQLLENSETDEIAFTAAYHFLFRAMLISGNYSREKIREFFMLTTKNEAIIEQRTNKIMKERERRAASGTEEK